VGSKLRRLRVQAGVTGLAHQKREREAYRRRERAGRAERAKLEFQDGNVIVATNSPGGRLRTSSDLHERLKPAAAAFAGGAMPGIADDLAFHAAKLEEQRLDLAHILGPHDGAAELADGIHLAALARAHASIHPNHEVVEAVWEQALAELRRGVPPAELSALRKPEPTVTVRGDGPVSPPEPVVDAPPRPRTRRSGALLATVAVLAMLAGLEPPKGDR
jgi:hypothetical protein